MIMLLRQPFFQNLAISENLESHILMIVIAELVNIYPSGNASDIILYKDTLESITLTFHYFGIVSF